MSGEQKETKRNQQDHSPLGQKTGEASKNMERKTKVLLGSTLRRPLSFPPGPKWDHRDTLLCCRLGALPPPPLPHPPLPSQQRFRPGEAPLLRSGWPWVQRSRASCRVWRSSWPVEGLRVSEGRDQGVLVIIMAPADTSAVPSFCALTPSEIQSPLVFTRGSDGMFWSFWGNGTRTGGGKDVCSGRPVRTCYYTVTGTSTEVLHRYVQSNQATHWNTEQ